MAIVLTTHSAHVLSDGVRQAMLLLNTYRDLYGFCFNETLCESSHLLKNLVF